ncbi:hypothetical protein M9Y10_043439 [Tritrichomonas musculus]|uniref:DUF3447 domain-containing protein n=1 Tax=Tritrichomonas musculus TaxID=1915356 RepID=A0ABR2K0U8_9EUKA
MVEEYLVKMRNIQRQLLEFIDNDTNAEENFQNLIKNLEDSEVRANRCDFRLFLRHLAKICCYHHRSPTFMSKIEKIILYYKDDLTKNYSNEDIYSIFRKSKLVILFLLENDIIKMTESIARQMYELKQLHFFASEVTSFIKSEEIAKNDEEFEKKRKIGENDSYICQLIRNDDLNEFISYVNRSNIDLKSNIEKSIFETHTSLIDSFRVTLIEYAAFFGSIQIFKYLIVNGVELRPYIWSYAIHGGNFEMIHLIEEKNTDSYGTNFNDFILDAIKYHQNDIANYLITNHSNAKYKLISAAIENYNFLFIDNEVSKKMVKLIQNDYVSIIEILLKTTSVKINAKIVLFALIYSISF